MPKIYAYGFLSAALFFTPAMAVGASSWQDQVNSVLGMQGQEMPGGVLRFEYPRTNIYPIVFARPTLPELTEDGYAAFKGTAASALVVIEVPLLEREVNPVIAALEQGGFKTSAVHNHLIEAWPVIIFVHANAVGNPVTLAQTLRNAIAQSALPPINDDNSQDSDDTAPGIDTKTIQSLIGGDEQALDGVWEASVDFPGTVTIEGVDAPAAMGPQNEFHFQPTGGGNAASVAEICVTGTQVDTVVKTLKQNGFQVTALHNHWTEDNPHLFFIHAWKVDNAVAMAKVYQTILKQIGAQ